MSYNGEGLFAILAALGAILFFFFIIGIVLYVLASIGLYKLASNEGIENPWLAWIPVGNLYIIGKIVKSVKIGDWEIPKLDMVLPLGVAALIVAGWIPFIGSLASIAFAVLYYFVLYGLYKRYRPDQAVAWLVLSIVLSFMMPIFLFIMRNDRPAQQQNYNM